MDRLFLIANAAEVARRRALLPGDTFLEAWPDVELPRHVWVGTGAKAVLDGVGPSLAPVLSLDADAVSIYYGPWLTDMPSIPTEESLRTRIVSAHGIAAAWATRDRFGRRTDYQPTSPADPVFALRRPRTDVAHFWRLFRTKDEARVYLRELYGNDPQARGWADALTVSDYATLISRYGVRAETDTT
jgi:hypothetical protein